MTTLNPDCGVYAITSPTGRRYIGSTLSFRKRWRTHLQQLRSGKHHSHALLRAFRKYGEEAFTFSKLAIVAPADLLVTEQAFFDAVVDPRDLYNSARVAGNCLGVKRTAETRAKLSAQRRGRKHTPEARAKLVALKTGLTIPAEVRAKISRSKTDVALAHNTSGYAGVDFASGSWRARANVRGVRHYLGQFKTAALAAQAIAAYRAEHA